MLFVLLLIVAFVMGIISTLLCLIKLDKVCIHFGSSAGETALGPKWPTDIALLDVPIFPVCHSLANGQYCLCCTIFQKVGFTPGPQGVGDGTRACQKNFWQRPSIVKISPCCRSMVN